MLVCATVGVASSADSATAETSLRMVFPFQNLRRPA
jgi:hypothetical protein